MLNQVPPHVRYALIVVIVTVVIILLSRWTGKGTAPTVPPLSYTDVRAVVRAAATANTAAHTQPNRLDALVDLTAALATLNTATMLAGEDVVTKAAGVSVATLEQELVVHRQQLMSELEA